jgi:hypothetical protein
MAVFDCAKGENSVVPRFGLITARLSERSEQPYLQLISFKNL